MMKQLIYFYTDTSDGDNIVKSCAKSTKENNCETLRKEKKTLLLIIYNYQILEDKKNNPVSQVEFRE